MIKLQVRVWKLTKMHDYFIVPPCIICTPCIICFRRDTSGIFWLWAFRKYILLCVSNVHNKKYAPLKQNICIFLYILMWNIFSDLYVTCGHCQMELVQISLQHHFFINVKKCNDNFLTCLEMFLLFWYAFLNLLFFFSNHCFLFPTLKITTEAVSSLGNTFNLFNEWKRVI